MSDLESSSEPEAWFSSVYCLETSKSNEVQVPNRRSCVCLAEISHNLNFTLQTHLSWSGIASVNIVTSMCWNQTGGEWVRHDLMERKSGNTMHDSVGMCGKFVWPQPISDSCQTAVLHQTTQWWLKRVFGPVHSVPRTTYLAQGPNAIFLILNI